MSVFDHISQHDLVRFGLLFDDQHVIVGPDAVGILGDLFHRARFEHPVVVIVDPLAVGLLLVGFVPIGVGNQLHQLQIHPHLGFQLILDAFQLVGIKTLQVDVVALAGVAVLLEDFQHLGGDVFSFLLMEPGGLDFRVEADVLAG
ncbi:hypothetical protein D3C80_1667120 [compost metagenome]